MLFRCVCAEWQKLRRSYIWLALAVLPALSAVLGTFNFLSNIAILKNEWYSLWSQHALFYCILFAPALTGVYCAYVCRLEHLNRNWNMVLTQPVAPLFFIAAKLSVVSGLTAATQLLIGIFFVISGTLAGFSSPIPIELLYWLLRGWLSLTACASLLLALSLLIRAFAVPPALGLLGGFLSLPALSKGFGHFFPFSLVPLSMCSQSPSKPMQCGNAQFLVSCIFYFFLGVLCCLLLLKRCDVKTD